MLYSQWIFVVFLIKVLKIFRTEWILCYIWKLWDVSEEVPRGIFIASNAYVIFKNAEDLWMKILLNKTGIWLPLHSKAKLLTAGFGEESAAFIIECQARSSGQLVLKKPELPGGF